MNKAELVSAIATKADITKSAAQAMLDATLEAITEDLAQGNDVAMPGFGTFSVRERSARKGVNPATGESMDIPASKSAGFKAGKKLKETLNP